jgi:hypothetical protein
MESLSKTGRLHLISLIFYQKNLKPEISPNKIKAAYQIEPLLKNDR